MGDYFNARNNFDKNITENLENYFEAKREIWTVILRTGIIFRKFGAVVTFS